MRPHDIKYIGFKHQRENKQNSDKAHSIRFLIEKVRNGNFTIYRKLVKMCHRDLRDLGATDPLRQ